MNGRGKSDRLIVPEKRSNNDCGEPQSAESAEERSLTKGNPCRQNSDLTQGRIALQNALERIRRAAKRDKKMQFNALWHHIYNPSRLWEAYFCLKRETAPGVDGETWRHYGKNLEENLKDLSERLKRGAYHAKPVKRVYIPKADGRKRPIGIPTLEDKIVQRSTVEVLQAVYETDFKGFSYGFRPNRSPHNALDAVTVGIERMKVNWVLDADIRGFFDAIDHEWLMKFVEHRISDKRVLRHIKKWLNAGVFEDGTLTRATEGTPQGGCISPLLANIYLHYAFDLWAENWRKHCAKGDVIIIRYADDFVVGFQHKWEAEHFLSSLTERLRKFNLELHSDKTRLIEFGRFASQNRKERGVNKPESFTFLGFTHICGKTRNGKFTVLRKSSRKKVLSKLAEIRESLRKRMHVRVSETGKWLTSVLRGHYNYYGVPRNYPSMSSFRQDVTLSWFNSLKRRSQKHKMNWERMKVLATRWLPIPKIVHPYPNQRLCVKT